MPLFGTPVQFVASGREEYPHEPVLCGLAKIGRNDPCPCGSGKKYKKCCSGGAPPPPAPFNVDLKAFRSERIVVTIKAGTVKRKVLQIIFSRDNSVYVNFPYFRHRVGLLASATIPANHPGPVDVNLEIGGKIASHLVKYSHHPDGRAHFSQDGKVRTEIRRQSLALDEQEGHMFTVMLHGLNAFDNADPVDAEPGPKRTTITFDVPGDDPQLTAFKLVGRWYDVGSLQWGGTLQSTVGPIVAVGQTNGKQMYAFAIANPREDARHVLLLTCEPISPLGPDTEMLLFLGGFDSKEVVNDRTKDSGFLAFLYPAADAETLKEKLGCLDYRAGA